MAKGDSKNVGIVRHTQDCGKRLTKVLNVSKLAIQKELENPLIMVSYRQELSGWERKPYYANGECYVRFLKKMRHDFGHLIPEYTANHVDKPKPFTKAIDEVNYMGITKPLQEEEKKKREIKKMEKKSNKKITNEKIIS